MSSAVYPIFGTLAKIKNYPFKPYLFAHRKRYTLGLISLVAVDAINVALPLVVKMAIDALEPKDLKGVYLAAAWYLGLMLLQSGGRYLWRVYLIGTSHLIARELRLKLYRHLQRLPLPFYQSVSTGDLMSRATNDIESVRMAVGPGVLVSLDAVLMLVLIIPVMLALSWKLSLLAFAFYPMVPWITAKIGDRIDGLFENLQKKMSSLSSYAQESFAGVRLIRSLVLENEVCARFRVISEEYKAQGMQLAKNEAVFSPTLGLLTNLGSFLILLVGGLDVLSGAITVGTFIAFQRFVVQLSWPMEAVGWAVTMHREGFAAQRRLSEIMNAPQVNSVEVAPLNESEPEKGLEIKHLHFRYPTTQKGYFQFELNLHELRLNPGTKVGVVGRVGAGKSTLFNLILRLYEPTEGSLYFENKDVLSIPLRELRRDIAIVEQQVFLFSESIKTNVGLGFSSTEIGLDEVRRLAEFAQIHEEVEALEKQFDTRLGERGVNLSGGQKQRLALIRALARHPKLLLLDDAFAAVDVEVEQKIIDSFFELTPNTSVLFASHRLSVMPRMDEVWLLDAGNLAERGTHAELLRVSPLYQSLWDQSRKDLEKEKLGWKEDLHL